MSDIKAVTVPKWGMNMQAGKLIGWLVEEGAVVHKGDEIAELESEKIVNVVEANVSGVLRRKVAEEGENYPVGKLLAVVADTASSDADIDAFIAKYETAFANELSHRVAAETGPNSVEVHGRNIAYFMQGENEPTTVFIHGIGGQKEAWMLSQAAIAGSSRSVAIDLPGHGSSTKSVDRGDLDELAAYVIGVMDELDIACAHIVGHSLGGAIAAHIATHYSQRAKSLFLISSAGAGTVVSPAFIENFVNASSRRDVKNALAPLFVDAQRVSRELVQTVLRSKRSEGANECMKMIGDAAGTALASLSPAKTLEAISVPVSIVWGAQDGICSLDNTVGLPGSVKLTVIEGAGHMVQVEALERVNGLILEHIKAVG